MNYNRFKLTVYVPETHLESVKEALFAAGAGRYDGYDRCCWQVRGTGQFRPLDGSSPYIGVVGRTESVQEWRVEMICPEDRLPDIKAALMKAHPYQVPAYDFIRTDLV